MTQIPVVGTAGNEPVRTSFALPFLNGVCRHEPLPPQGLTHKIFLNGVCRHEHEIIEMTENG